MTDQSELIMETESDALSVEEVDQDPDWTDEDALSKPFNLRRGIQILNLDNVPASSSVDFKPNEMPSEDLATIRDPTNHFWEYLKQITPVHYKWGKKMELDEVMEFSEDIEEPVTRIPKSLVGTAMKIFKDITMYCGDAPRGMGGSKGSGMDDILSSFLGSICMQTAKFRDEAFVQLVKQLRNNPSDESQKNAWAMLACLASCCSPSREFLNPLMNWLLNIIESHNQSLYKTMGKCVLAKVYNAYKLRVRRTFQLTQDEAKCIVNCKKTRVVVHLMNGTYMQCYVESWESFEDLKTEVMNRLGLPNEKRNIFGFQEVVEKKDCYEERYLDDFFSCTEILGFWNSYRRSRSDLKDFKLYFNLRASPLINADEQVIPYQYLSFLNDFKRGKITATNSDIINCIALSMQADLEDCPEKNGHLNRVVMNYVPVTRKNEGEAYWAGEVMKSYKEKAGKSRESCIAAWFETAVDFTSYGATQFTGTYERCSDADNHDENIPGSEEGSEDRCIFLVKHNSLQILSNESRQVQVDMDLSEISNWGCSKDQFVYSTGETHSRVKEYFKCPAAPQLCWLLNIYAHQKAELEPDWTSILLLKHIHLDKKKRNVSTFSKVSDL